MPRPNICQQFPAARLPVLTAALLGRGVAAASYFLTPKDMNNFTSNSDCSKFKRLRVKLSEIIEKAHASISACVADEALQYDEDPTLLFRDLMCSGCAGGTVSSLISYHDTHRFFDTYYDEIETLREDCEDNQGAPLRIEGDLRNWLAWFAFEETALRIAREELDLDI